MATNLYAGSKTDAEISAALPLCVRCGRRHFASYHHSGQCSYQFEDGTFCPEDALRLDGRGRYDPTGKRFAQYCQEHWARFYSDMGTPETRDAYEAQSERNREYEAGERERMRQLRSFNAREASRPLAESLGQGIRPSMIPGADFDVESASRKGHWYPMVWTPEGIAVHQFEGCLSEVFNDVLVCQHVKKGTAVNNTSVAVRQASTVTPVGIDFTEEQVAVIKNTIAKGVTDSELQLFVSTCRRTGLDPFLKQIYAIERRSQVNGQWVKAMSIQVGIDGMRLIAERTNKYAGQDPIEWLDTDGAWSEVWTGKGGHPVAARCSVYRKDWQGRKATAVARWDSYAQDSATWKKMPDVMIGKCAEALALRRAFPAEMSGLAATIDHEYDPEADAAELRAASWSQSDEQRYIEERTASHERAEADAGDSSSGRMSAFEAEEEGSNPSSPAITPDDLPFDVPITEGQKRAIIENGKRLGWNETQLAGNIGEQLQDAPEGWQEYLTASGADGVIEWQASLLSAKGKAAVKVDQD